MLLENPRLKATADEIYEECSDSLTYEELTHYYSELYGIRHFLGAWKGPGGDRRGQEQLQHRHAEQQRHRQPQPVQRQRRDGERGHERRHGGRLQGQRRRAQHHAQHDQRGQHDDHQRGCGEPGGAGAGGLAAVGLGLLGYTAAVGGQYVNTLKPVATGATKSEGSLAGTGKPQSPSTPPTSH